MGENRNEGSTIKETQGVGDNNMCNAIDMDDPQTIPLGIINALGHKTPQNIIGGMSLSNSMKWVRPITPSNLSRNNSEASSTACLFQNRKKVINPRSRKRLKSIRDTAQNKNLKNLDEHGAHHKSTY